MSPSNQLLEDVRDIAATLFQFSFRESLVVVVVAAVAPAASHSPSTSSAETAAESAPAMVSIPKRPAVVVAASALEAVAPAALCSGLPSRRIRL